MNFTREDNLYNKKGTNKAIISLIVGITFIIILLSGIGLFNKIEQLKSETVKLKNKNTELMNENTTLAKELSSVKSELKRVKMNLSLAKSDLEKATFELGEDMLTLPKHSSKFDCDDSALYMYLYFTNLGYDVDILFGNLDLDNETYWQCNHSWVWVDSGIDGGFSYDWGHFNDDDQHYYGYNSSYRDLLKWVLNDQ